jgi:RNA polymerase primary sigma factor
MKQLVITKQITNRASGAVDKYLNDISKYELIPPEKEVELTRRIKNGDLQALEKLTLANLRFVVSVAKQYQNRGLSLQDLINEGNFGLIKAAQRFDETRGFKFISYAVWWIRQSIIQAIGENSRVVRLPFNKIANVNKVNKAISELEQQFQREPSDDEIASITKFTEETIKITNKIAHHPLSLDAPLSKNGDDDERNLNETLDLNNLPSPDGNLISESLQTEINQAFKGLSKQEVIILENFFGLNGKSNQSLDAISKKLKLSRERVRQIKNMALRKLKKSPNKKVLLNYV